MWPVNPRKYERDAASPSGLSPGSIAINIQHRNCQVAKSLGKVWTELRVSWIADHVPLSGSVIGHTSFLTERWRRSWQMAAKSQEGAERHRESLSTDCGLMVHEITRQISTRCRSI
jgi:hypothetical protein